MKKLLSLVLVLVTLFALTASAQVPDPTIYAKVTPATDEYGDTPKQIDVYQLPGEYRPVIGNIDAGAMVFVTFEGSTWHKVKMVSGDVSGWVRDMDISFTTRGYSAANHGCTLRSAATIQSSDGYASLRWGPDTYYDEIDRLPNGRYVWKYETEGKWTRVLLEDGRSGYVYSSLLKKTDRLVIWPQGLKAYVQVTGNTAAAKKGPSYSSGNLRALRSGDVIEIISQNGSFYEFIHPVTGETAYISYDIVSPESLNEIATSSALYYDHPLTYACDVITKLSAGTKLKVMASDGYVSYVKYADGEGYVYDYTLKY
ncbi:MAG: SH3 domain-containing protein [Clostridia bacterium]|nr:SH3 domain-containing protein [Clostridia bacterium]